MPHSVIEKVLSYRYRAAELAVGLMANQLMSMGFDWVLYPFVIYRCGVFWGGFIMMLLSLVTCLLTL